MSSGRYVVEGSGPFFVVDLAEPAKTSAPYQLCDDALAEITRLEHKHQRTTPVPLAQQTALFDQEVGVSSPEKPGDLRGCTAKGPRDLAETRAPLDHPSRYREEAL